MGEGRLIECRPLAEAASGDRARRITRDERVGARINAMSNPAFAYVCMPSHVEEHRVLAWRDQMTSFALGEGLMIARWFVDDRRSSGAGFAAMTAALERGEADRVVVPERSHLARSQEGTGWLVQHVLGSHLGARVHAVNDVERRRMSW